MAEGLPWRDGSSKIRDPDGRLLEAPVRPRHELKGALPTSTAYYKREALEVASRTDLRPVDKKRMIDMIRAECSLFRRTRDLPPEPPDEPIVKVKCKPPSKKYLKRRAIYDRRTKPSVKRSKRQNLLKMQASLSKRAERAERRRLKTIDRAIEALM